MTAVMQVRGPAFRSADRDPSTSALARASDAARRSRARVARRRRRLLATAAALGLGVVVLNTGTALGGSSLAAPERGPHVVAWVVEPGDTMWSIAAEIAPDRDPRGVVDELVQAHGSTDLSVGETITWVDG